MVQAGRFVTNRLSLDPREDSILHKPNSMQRAHLLASLSLLCTLAIAPAANAADARLSDCISMAKQVAAALDSAQPGDTASKARTQEITGRSFCSNSMYSQGVAHYTKALQILGKA